MVRKSPTQLPCVSAGGVAIIERGRDAHAVKMREASRTVVLMRPGDSTPSGVTSQISYTQMFTLNPLTVAKLQLWSSNENNLLVGGQHNLRDRIKGSWR